MKTAQVHEWKHFEQKMLSDLRVADEVYIGTYRLSFWDNSAYVDAIDDCEAGIFEMIVGHQPKHADDAAHDLSPILGALPEGAKTRLLPRFHAKYIVLRGESWDVSYFGSFNFGNSASNNLACRSSRTMDVKQILRLHRRWWGWRPPKLNVPELLRTPVQRPF